MWLIFVADNHCFLTSAMPQMGQLPGLFFTTWGCIGQVYWTAWLPSVVDSDVLQPVIAGMIATSANAIMIQYVFFMFFSFIYFCLFPPSQ
jgi:hypothetical protein